MKLTTTSCRKRWFFTRAMFRAYRERLEKASKDRSGTKKAKGSVQRPLFAEALEPRVLFSGTPAPVEEAPDVDQNEQTAQAAEMLDAVDATDETADEAENATPEGVVDALYTGTEFTGNLDLEGLEDAEVERLAKEAVARWEASGLTEEQSAALEEIEYVIDDLGGNTLGYVEGMTVYLDDDAAGLDWYVDDTEWLDEEFVEVDGLLQAELGENGDAVIDAGEGVDLLSVLMHEQGHIVGLLDDSSGLDGGDIMDGIFDEGERRLIAEDRAEGAIAGSLEGAHYAVTEDALTNGFFASNGAAFTTSPGYKGGSNPATIDNWTYTGTNQFGINGITSGLSNPFGPTDKLAARYWAFLQRPGSLSQEIALEADTSYEFGFLAANRSSNAGAQGRVVIADNSNTYYDSTVTTWSRTTFQAVSAQFTTGASIDGPVTITLSNDSLAGDNTVNYANLFLSEAGVITYDPITNDADSGISSSKTYTHAIDFGRQSTYPTATINGVIFADGGTGAFPDPTGTSQTVGTGTSTLPNSNNDGNGTANPYLNGSNPADIEDLVGDMIWNNRNGEIKLTGLSVGAEYQFKLYNRPWGIGADRQQTIRFDTDKDGVAEETRAFNADDASDPYPAFSTASQVYALTYNCLAQSDTLTVNIDNHRTNATYHLYGLTNEVLLDAVDDTSYAGAVVADSPLGYWRLGESAGATVATDSSGNGRDLEYQNVMGANQGQAGATADGDTAIALVNTGADQIQSPNTTDFAFASGESFSIEYWAKFQPGNSTANEAGLITKGYDASQNRPWYLARLQRDGHVELFLRTSSGATKLAESTTNVEDGQWHYVVGVYDATAAEARIYVDGTLEGTATGVVAAAYGTNAGAFTVGNHLNRQVDGLIDEVAVYGAALTQEQIDAHYAAAPSLMRGTDEDTAVTIAAPGILGNDIPTDAPILGINGTTLLTGTSTNGADVTVNADGSFDYDPTASATIPELDEGAMLTDTFTYTTGFYEPIQGQVVRIVQNSAGKPLQLAEVEVKEFGTGTNLASGGTASQSSTLSSFVAGRANDGSTGNFQHTNNGAGQYWQVDLGGLKDLDLVNIFSRVGCCSQGRTADIQLQVFSDAAATNMVYNERILGIGTSDSRSVRVATLVATDDATVNIEVTGVNDAPVGVDDDGGSVTETADINSNPTTTGNVLTNDTDVDDPNSSFTATPATITGTYGSVVINNDGSFTYTLDDADPDTQALTEGQMVTDTFAYTVNDNHSGGNAKTGTANLTISITGANDAPVLVDDAAVVNEDGPAISIDVFAQTATETTLTNPALEQGVSAFSGSIAGTLNDPFAYNPANPTSVLPDQAYSSNGDGFHNNGADAIIRYDVATPVEVNATNQLVVDLYGRADCCQDRDDNIDIEFLDVGGSVVGTIVGTGIGGTEHLRVSSTGVVPDGTTIGGIRVIGHNGAFTLMEIRAAVLGNDTDPDTGDTFTIQSIDTAATTGLAAITDAVNGIVSYDPNGAFESLAIGETATDTFTYTVIDSNGDTATATVTVTITGENDGPTANADNQLTDPGNFITDEDTSFTTGNVLDNDTDPDTTNVLSVLSINTSGTSGTVIDNGDGTFGYDPNGQFESLAVGDVATDSFDYTVTDFSAGRFIMVQNNGTASRRMDIGEIEVFAPGVTPAVNNAGGSNNLNPTQDLATNDNGASVHSKTTNNPHGNDDVRLIDGKETTAGGTWSSSGVGNFVIIDLGANHAVETVRVHQRNDGCCQDRLSNFTVTLLADDGTGNPGAVVQSGVFGSQPATNSFGEVTFSGTATATATATVTIEGTNDAPVLTPGGVNQFNPVSVSDSDNDGDSVAYLLNGAAIDVDDAALPRGIAITDFTVTAPGTGKFQFKSGTGSWTDLGTVSESAARLLLETDRVRFVPDGATLNGGEITFRAWDQTAGIAGSPFDITTTGTGGTSAFSMADATSSVTVANVVKDEATNDIVYTALDGGGGEVNHLTVSIDGGQLLIVDGNDNNISSTEPDFDPTNPGVRMAYTGENLIINTGIEADIITIGDMTGFTGSLTIDGGADQDRIIYLADGVTLAAGNDASFTAEEIDFINSDLTTTDGDITLDGTGGSGVINQIGVHLIYSDLTANGGGSITLTGQGGNLGTNADGVYLSHNVDLAVNGGGDLTITGTGGSGTGSNSAGIAGVGVTMASSGGGDIVLTGTSAGGGLNNIGIDLVTTTIGTDGVPASGSVSLTGAGSTVGTHSNAGVRLNRVNVDTAADESITITGTGNGAGNSNIGVLFSSSVDMQTRGTGAITLDGTSNSATGTNNDGVLLASGSALAVENGDLTITGSGLGSGSNNEGVSTTRTTLTSSGTGNIVITGTSAGGGLNNRGIMLSYTEVSTVTGTGGITLTGTGSSNGTHYNEGVRLLRANLATGGNGAISITGTGGGSAGSSGNTGVTLLGGGSVTAGGSGTVDIVGTGGTGANYISGVYVTGAGPISSTSGAITITGTAGTGTLHYNKGVDLRSVSVTTGGSIGISGTGSTSSSGMQNSGLYLYNATINAGSTLGLTGTGGTGSHYNMGIYSIVSRMSSVGSLTMIGSGNAGTTGFFNNGVYLRGGTLNGGGGSDIRGTGGGGTRLNYGVYILSVGTTTLGVGNVSVNVPGGGLAPAELIRFI